MLEYLFGPLARRVRFVRLLLDIQQRYGEIKGSYLASAVTLNIFLSLFPLLLVAIAALGFFTSNNVDVVQAAINDVIGKTGPIPTLVERALQTAVEGRRAASLVGFVLLLWGALGVAAAITYAVDATWQLGGRGLIERLPGLLWGLGAAVLLTLTIGVTALVDLYADGWILQIVATVVALGVNFLFFMWTFLVLTSKRLPFRAHYRGAILGAVGLELLKQLVGPASDLLSRPAAIWGSIGAVFAVIIGLAIFGRLLVYASTYNVVHWEKGNGTITMSIEMPNLPGVNPEGVNRGGLAAGDATEEQ